MTQDRGPLIRRAAILAIFTIFYNLVEGVVSVVAGAEDETVSLFGFGLDSFVEVISGIGVWHMVRRLTAEGGDADRFEQRALRITGGAFYLLSIGLVVAAVINLIQGHHPATTVWGIAVALVSLLTMWYLARLKVKVGRQLGSAAILADAACTRTCLYLSVVLLLASVGYELTGIGSVDSVGSLVIAWLSAAEGREAFDKARGLRCRCSGTCGG